MDFWECSDADKQYLAHLCITSKLDIAWLLSCFYSQAASHINIGRRS